MPNATPNAGLSFIKKAAPWIGTILSATVPGAAPFVSVASKLLSTGLGTTVASNPQAVKDAITEAMASPEQLATLKTIDDNFATQMKAMGIQSIEDLAKISADDMANARGREIALRDWYPKVLASVVVIACLVGEGLYFRYGAPSNASPELIGRILGTLDSALMLVLAYYFGSSMGSDRKTELLANNNNK